MTMPSMPEVRRLSEKLRLPLGIAASLLLLVSAGCSPTIGGAGRTGLTGGLMGDSAGANTSARFIRALEGGVIGQASGLTLGNADRQRALEAEYRALEAAPGGQPVVWQGSAAGGSVVAAAPYQVGSQNCRQYSHTVTVNGQPVTARGAACRNPDGSWTPLT